MPATGEGISEFTLSVETSSNGSSRETGSPSFLSHCTTVAAIMLSPSFGRKTSMMSIVMAVFPLGCFAHNSHTLHYCRSLRLALPLIWRHIQLPQHLPKY